MTMDNISTSKIGHISGNFTNILVFGGSYAYHLSITSIIQAANVLALAI